MSENNGGFRVPSSISTETNRSYALSGKIMLSAIVVLFFVLILMFTLHLYARWYLHRARRRRHSPNARRNPRRTRLVFYVGPDANVAAPAARGGLEARVLKSLPVFTFSSETHPDSALECAVCLSGFEENESGRVLPKCKHTFHLECIDMWFHSHSTCPLCRSTVEEFVPVSENPRDIILTTNNEPLAGESGPNQSSDLCATGQYDDGRPGTSTIGTGRKLSVEVSTRNTEGFEGEPSGCDSGPNQCYKSPMSRMLSFKRILSRDKRGSGASPCLSPTNAASCESVTVSEPDIEQGGSDDTRDTQG